MSVVEQVNYSSFTKNSSLMLLGIRDVYQMMEASLLWNPKQVREKIIESLHSQREEAFNILLKNLSEEEKEQICKLLNKLIENMEGGN